MHLCRYLYLASGEDKRDVPEQFVEICADVEFSQVAIHAIVEQAK